MKTVFALLALSLAASAQATGNHKPPPPPPATVPSINVDTQADAWSGSRASTGPVSYEEFSRNSMYVLPPPAQAAPLPPGLCPEGDSMSVSVLGGLLFSYSTSRVRTEMECLDKVLAAWRETPKAVVIQAPQLPPAPPPPAKKPQRKVAPNASATGSGSAIGGKCTATASASASCSGKP